MGILILISVAVLALEMQLMGLQWLGVSAGFFQRGKPRGHKIASVPVFSMSEFQIE
jgi:hypothetical protein